LKWGNELCKNFQTDLLYIIHSGTIALMEKQKMPERSEENKNSALSLATTKRHPLFFTCPVIEGAAPKLSTSRVQLY